MGSVMNLSTGAPAEPVEPMDVRRAEAPRHARVERVWSRTSVLLRRWFRGFKGCRRCNRFSNEPVNLVHRLNLLTDGCAQG